MICPKCKSNNFTLIQEEVDISVGTQTLTTGGECKDCGLMVCCSYCGGWDDKHTEYCEDVKKLVGD